MDFFMHFLQCFLKIFSVQVNNWAGLIGSNTYLEAQNISRTKKLFFGHVLVFFCKTEKLEQLPLR